MARSWALSWLLLSAFGLTACTSLDSKSPVKTLEFFGAFYAAYQQDLEQGYDFDHFYRAGYIKKVDRFRGELSATVTYDLRELFYQGTKYKIQAAFDFVEQYKNRDVSYKLVPQSIYFRSKDARAKATVHVVNVGSRPSSALFTWIGDVSYRSEAKVVMICGRHFPEEGPVLARIDTFYSEDICKIVSFAKDDQFRGLCRVTIESDDTLPPFLASSAEDCAAQSKDFLFQGSSKDGSVRLMAHAAGGEWTFYGADLQISERGAIGRD